MLKITFKAFIAAALLLPSATFADDDKSDKTDSKKTKTAETTEPQVEEEIVEEEVIVMTVDSRDTDQSDKKAKSEKKTTKATAVYRFTQGDGEDSVVWKSNDKGRYRVIQLTEEDVPKQLSVILEQAQKGEGKDGKPKTMTFRLGEAGQIQLQGRIREAVEAAEGDAKKAQEGVIRIMRNVGPGAEQLKILAIDGDNIEEIKEKLADVKGTISISTSSSSSSTNGEKPTVVTNSQIRIIGPDGKVQEIELDGNAAGGASVSKAVQEALKKSGKTLPADIEKKVKEAMERAEKRSRAIWVQGDRATPASGARASIDSKLDLILKRLEKMEAEIEQLKKK